MNVFEKINNLKFEKKETVNTLLSIMKKDICGIFFDFGFFDNSEDFEKFKNYMDYYTIVDFVENKFNKGFFEYLNEYSNEKVEPIKLSGNGIFDLNNKLFWVKVGEELLILRFEDLRIWINVEHETWGNYECFKNYEGAINNLMRL